MDILIVSSKHRLGLSLTVKDSQKVVVEANQKYLQKSLRRCYFGQDVNKTVFETTHLL
jgi:hypothetical protein